MNIDIIYYLVLGLVSLIAGAEIMVRGGSRLAALLGISPLIVGLTIVAFGTSSPELGVGVQSSLAGQTDLAVGNVVGSNIFNILFILGISALITPLVVSKRLIKLDVPIMIFVSISCLIFSYNGQIDSVEGILLFLGFLIYTAFIIIQSRKEKDGDMRVSADVNLVNKDSLSNYILNILLIIGGLIFLVLGSRWFVDGCTELARLSGVSEMVIGLTVVAAGTSLPELVTSIIASVRGEKDIALGNVIGSNIFNILVVLGLSAFFSNNGIAVTSSALYLDIPIMIAALIFCLPIFFTGQIVTRWEGLLFVIYYLAYVAYLIFSSALNTINAQYSNIVLVFVIPLIFIIFIIYSLKKYPRI